MLLPATPTFRHQGQESGPMCYERACRGDRGVWQLPLRFEDLTEVLHTSEEESLTYKHMRPGDAV